MKVAKEVDAENEVAKEVEVANEVAKEGEAASEELASGDDPHVFDLSVRVLTERIEFIEALQRRNTGGICKDQLCAFYETRRKLLGHRHQRTMLSMVNVAIRAIIRELGHFTDQRVAQALVAASRHIEAEQKVAKEVEPANEATTRLRSRRRQPKQ